jgi:predicted nucleic acid-binding protein
MNLVLDTNAYSNWRRFGHWERLLVQAELVWVPSIVLGELRAGFLNGRFAVKNESKLADFFLILLTKSPRWMLHKSFIWI